VNNTVYALALLASLAVPAGLGVPSDAQASPRQSQGSGPGYEMLKDLQTKAQSALKSGDTKSATRYASELLRKNTDRRSWNYGNVIYEGNQILGLAALKEGNIAAAKRYLIAAGKTPGSPQLNSFGPEMPLAQELLKKGEKGIVLEFLDLVARFWATPPAGGRPEFAQLAQQHAAKIRQWKTDIRAGKQPRLNRFDFSRP
jgi:hypothetical protein